MSDAATFIRDLAEAIRSSRAPAGVETRFVAIDGPGGSGKSSLARLLAVELDAPIIQTDDFASWDNPVDWWPELIARALQPLALGQPASYQPTSWDGEEKEPIQVEPSAFVILEGVTATREAFRPYLATRSGSRRRAMCDSAEGSSATASRLGHSGSSGWRRRIATSSASVRPSTPTVYFPVTKASGLKSGPQDEEAHAGFGRPCKSQGFPRPVVGPVVARNDTNCTSRAGT